MSSRFNFGVVKRQAYYSLFLLASVLTLFIYTEVETSSGNEISLCSENRTELHKVFCGDRLKCKNGTPIDDVFSEWLLCEISKYNKPKYCVVKKESICKEESICSNMNPCGAKCDSHYSCKNSQCVSRSTVCNANPCDGCTEEDHEWNNGVGFKCRRNGKDCVLPQQLVHDDIADCDGGTDLCFEAQLILNLRSRTDVQIRENLIRSKCFLCLNDVTVIAVTSVCDGIIDCPDLSDECLCDKDRPSICEQVISYDENGFMFLTLTAPESAYGGPFITRFPGGASTLCTVGNVMCSGAYCISRESVCDGKMDCREDEGYSYCRGTAPCSRSIKYEEKCRCPRRGSCVSFYGTACDGVADCPMLPGSWGYIAINQDHTFPVDECEASCVENPTIFQCIDTDILILGVPTYYVPCDRVSAGNETVHLKAVDEEICDGRKHCLHGEDEVNCKRFMCDGIEEGILSIELDKVCDGIVDCRNSSDETKELCGSKRFFCPALGGKKVSIDMGLKCDFWIACDDETDEMNCTDDRFYCENKKPLFVLAKQTFDGRGDCTDWSDECPTINQSTATDGFSSRYDLVANPILRAIVWIMGLLSIGGNGLVIIRETKRLRNNKRKMSAMIVANKLLILNLACSDVIMGIYLFSIGIAGLAMQGVYCSKDLIWRSSTTCTILGVLSVLSGETSVITMLLLTSCRIYSIYRPFKSSRHPQKKTVFLMILLAWGISLLIATLPLSPSLSGMFVSHAEFEYSPYSSNATVTQDNTKTLFKRLLTYDLKPNTTFPDKFSVTNFQSWKDIESESKKYFNHEHFKIKRTFGYYSVDSVCIPKFFVSQEDRAWPFSFAVNVFNFFAFVFVAFSYVAIYIKSSEKTSLRKSSMSNDRDDENRTMQLKILRLIITDFCCWIPICIMAFCKLGGANVSNTAYVVAAIVLLPINSALNPVLYSDLPDALYKKVTTGFNEITSLTSSVFTASTSINVRTNDEESTL
uniref:uncharacterized protein LOC120336918 isoform X3 n=1 Tax=Styela clava TaxID=7725 RepID=UPI00193AA6EB|nr:uncharacterized protein LOC120336918 isoform X3 [Styela clava]